MTADDATSEDTGAEIREALAQATRAIRAATEAIQDGDDWPDLEPAYRGAGELVDAVRELVRDGVDHLVHAVMDPSLVDDDRDTAPAEDADEFDHPTAIAVADAPRLARISLGEAAGELTGAADELGHLSVRPPED